MRWSALGASLSLLLSCAPKVTTSSLYTCTTALKSGTSWTPNVTGAGATNHDSTVSVTTEVHSSSVPVTGYSQAAPASQEYSFTFSMTSDPGAYGSVQLVADITSLSGVTTAYPMLVSLVDSAGHEFINLGRSGGSDCAGAGYFSAWSDPSTYPTQNSGCTVTYPTAYFDYYHWRERQLALPSVNTFPSCNWSGGTSTTSLSDPECAFNTNFFVGGKLAWGSGAVYTATYVVITPDKANAGTAKANLKVTVVKKQDANAGGAVDVNVVLVGNSIINASRTAQGQINLNTALQAAQSIYSATNANIKLGAIKVYEWTCDQGGDAYTSLESSKLEEMFYDGGQKLGATGTSLNLFMINSFSDNPGILGISGAIGGPAINGTAASGVAVSTFGQLASWNPGCTSSSCPASSWQSSFNDFVTTIAHESGHYLGLNHPSESSGTIHDFVEDTPICTATSSGFLTINSCLNTDTNVYPVTGKKCSQVCTSYNSSTGTFCPAVAECQFNYLMWWSSKFFKEGAGTGDGNLFSPYSGTLINYNPLVQ